MMMIKNEIVRVETSGFPDLVDLSSIIEDVLISAGVSEGLLTVFVPGSTAGITAIEYEPGLLQDLPALCRKLAPPDQTYEHDQTWHDGNGYSHLLAALFKPSLSIPISNGQPILGTWQQVILADFDNRPRHRKIVVQVMGE